MNFDEVIEQSIQIHYYALHYDDGLIGFKVKWECVKSHIAILLFTLVNLE